MMRLALFDLIDETAKVFTNNQPKYQSALQSLLTVYDQYLRQYEDIYITMNSRIKGETSLREKIIRNKFYKYCECPQDIFDNLHDLIGLSIECRFISDEAKMLDLVKNIFERDEHEYSVCKLDSRIYLNLKTPQPQLQRNGFTIYRIDGYFLENDTRINYELQIKSLIHNFWSDVEHQVVYKNNQLVQFDQFLQNLLGSIRDNLDVVDHQLQIVYNQVKKESEQTDEVGMSEEGFKMFLAKSINDLYTMKMMDSMGFTSNFKKCSGILSQYFYISDFLKCSSTQMRMVEYFEQFNLLKQGDLDFTKPIYLESSFEHYCPFMDKMGKYWESLINDDLQWHSFFMMLFAIESGNNIQDFTSFLMVVRDLIIEPTRFAKLFSTFTKDESMKIKDALLSSLADVMIEYHKIDMIFEENLLSLMEAFHQSTQEMDDTFDEFEKFTRYQSQIIETFKRKLKLAL